MNNKEDKECNICFSGEKELINLCKTCIGVDSYTCKFCTVDFVKSLNYNDHFLDEVKCFICKKKSYLIENFSVKNSEYTNVIINFITFAYFMLYLMESVGNFFIKAVMNKNHLQFLLFVTHIMYLMNIPFVSYIFLLIAISGYLLAFCYITVMYFIQTHSLSVREGVKRCKDLMSALQLNIAIYIVTTFLSTSLENLCTVIISLFFLIVLSGTLLMVIFTCGYYTHTIYKHISKNVGLILLCIIFISQITDKVFTLNLNNELLDKMSEIYNYLIITLPVINTEIINFCIFLLIALPITVVQTVLVVTKIVLLISFSYYLLRQLPKKWKTVKILTVERTTKAIIYCHFIDYVHKL